MSKKNVSEPAPALPELSEATRREMEAGRKAALENAAAQGRAEASRSQEALMAAEKEAEEKRQQAEDKLRVVAEAEAAHAAKAQPASSV